MQQKRMENPRLTLLVLSANMINTQKGKEISLDVFRTISLVAVGGYQKYLKYGTTDMKHGYRRRKYVQSDSTYALITLDVSNKFTLKSNEIMFNGKW